jgi:beta-phosphoglucomutase-like phosphatase (HAD superfamily)
MSSAGGQSLSSIPVAACFDLDGVLVDSESVKLTAWSQAVVAVLDPPAEQLAELDRYNRDHRGVPRREKFEVVLRRVLGVVRADELRQLLDAYEQVLAPGLVRVPALPGAQRFIGTWPGPVYLVTSAPEPEARAQVGRLGFREFDGYFSGSLSKAQSLRVIHESNEAIVFFGDAAADARAAREAGCAFVAVGPRRQEFDVDALRSVQTLEQLLEEEDSMANAVPDHPRVPRAVADGRKTRPSRKFGFLDQCTEQAELD